MMNAMISNIQKYCVHDGPGIRTTVFFKGCSLACKWCANPESISMEPQVGFISKLCKHCGKCKDICPRDALLWGENGPVGIDHSKCVNCRSCLSVCPSKALVPYGNEMSLDEVFREVKRDALFYCAEPRGGVTVSGGEPLLYAPFVSALFQKCHEADIHTCVETAGNVSVSALQEVLPHADLFLLDLKHMDTEKHREGTGFGNERILENIRFVAQSGADILFRAPLIPGYNDTLENIEATAAFLKTLPEKVRCYELMPYHRMAVAKYEAIGMPFLMGDLEPPTDEHLESVRAAYEQRGISCKISR